jgi:ABC-type transporter Mla subunit MlaD
MIEVRDYRTERMNRARFTLELKRALRSGIWVALSLIAGAAIAVRIANSIGANVGVSSQSVSFLVANANDVVAASDEVRFLGIPAGRIGSIRMTSRGPVITASFDSQYGHIYRNAQAVIRPNTALEDMYLDIVDPGTPSAGLAGTAQPLPAGQTDTSVNVDDVLNVFRSNTRASLRTLLANLGNGLADRGAALRQAFVDAVPFVQVAGRLSSQLAARATLLRQLVHNASVLTADLGQNQVSLRRLISSGSATLTTLESGSRNLDATLAELPGTLTDLKSSLGSVSGVVGRVDNAVKSLYPVAGDLPTSLAAVRRLSASASPAVQALQTPVRRLVPLARYLVPLSADLSATVSRLLPQMPAFDKLSGDLAGCRTGVQGFFEWNPSLAKYGDERGQSPRGNVAMGGQSSGVIGNPFEQAEPSCTSGLPIGGAVVTPGAEH